ncbi:hypothetical protein POM88_020894 [Heracleum sosnowskyi]|uniref:Uncharacterized protein n=1 Tax=Heracleum sosnowskyi TaxID=360622 RepID=A0AAD8IDR3_9APIA|nr:hypothetical protein POM88_020894 [Heracleum sosnowskyi]
MKAYKLRCLNNATRVFEISLKELSEYATSMEAGVHVCFEDFKFKAKEFSKMILVDGIFIIVLIAQNDKHITKVASDLRSPLSEHSWIVSDALHHMLLIENQLPLFFVTELLMKFDGKCHKSRHSRIHDLDSFLTELCSYFKKVGIISTIEKKAKCKSAWHLVVHSNPIRVTGD